MTDLPHLALKMGLGTFPDWSPRLIARNGDELRNALETASENQELCSEILGAAGEYRIATNQPDVALAALLGRLDALSSQLSDLRTILVAYGALYPDDQETNSLDMLRLLLPPVK